MAFDIILLNLQITWPGALPCSMATAQPCGDNVKVVFFIHNCDDGQRKDNKVWIHCGAVGVALLPVAHQVQANRFHGDFLHCSLGHNRVCPAV